MIKSISINELLDFHNQLPEKANACESFFLTQNGTALYYAIPIDQVLMDLESRIAVALCSPLKPQ